MYDNNCTIHVFGKKYIWNSFNYTTLIKVFQSYNVFIPVSSVWVYALDNKLKIPV